MNVRKLLFLIIVGIIISIVIYIAFSPKVIKIQLHDVLLELRQSAKKHGFNFQNIYLTQDNHLQGKIDGVIIIFSREKSFNEQILSLQKLLKSSTINSNTKLVDFRFTKIVVK